MITRTTNGDTQSAKFAGHETFCLRYGWPKKAVDATQSDPLVFTRDEAVITLGVGKNMVRSIRHWGLMTGILEESPDQPNNRGRHIRPSELGTLLFSAEGLDPYLEEPGTLWLLHWNLASRPDGPTTWYRAFNHFPESEFTKERLIAWLGDIAEQADWTRVADSSLKRDVDVFVRTYVPSRATKTLVLEDSLDSPLAELQVIGRDATCGGRRSLAANRGCYWTRCSAGRSCTGKGSSRWPKRRNRRRRPVRVFCGR